MIKLITLPSPETDFLTITVKPCGALVSMQWLDGHGLDKDSQADITATTRAQMFTGGKLCLVSLVALDRAYFAANEAACSRLSDYQESYGFCDTEKSALLDADLETAIQKSMRARKWLTVFPASNGYELAVTLIGLLGGHKSPLDLNQAELKAVRSMARAVIVNTPNEREASHAA